MFTYRLHLEDGSDIGTATYPSMVGVGELLFFGNGRRSGWLTSCPSTRRTSRRSSGCCRSRRRETRAV
jgi:hypothetical protein